MKRGAPLRSDTERKGTARPGVSRVDAGSMEGQEPANRDRDRGERGVPARLREDREAGEDRERRDLEEMDPSVDPEGDDPAPSFGDRRERRPPPSGRPPIPEHAAEKRTTTAMATAARGALLTSRASAVPPPRACAAIGKSNAASAAENARAAGGASRPHPNVKSGRARYVAERGPCAGGTSARPVRAHRARVSRRARAYELAARPEPRCRTRPL